MATETNSALHSPAVARASMVLPTPGGPNIRMPPPLLRLNRSNNDGFWNGRMIRRVICSLRSARPPHVGEGHALCRRRDHRGQAVVGAAVDHPKARAAVVDQGRGRRARGQASSQGRIFQRAVLGDGPLVLGLGLGRAILGREGLGARQVLLGRAAVRHHARLGRAPHPHQGVGVQRAALDLGARAPARRPAAGARPARSHRPGRAARAPPTASSARLSGVARSAARKDPSVTSSMRRTLQRGATRVQSPREDGQQPVPPRARARPAR
jgi:hypothetical protein